MCWSVASTSTASAGWREADPVGWTYPHQETPAMTTATRKRGAKQSAEERIAWLPLATEDATNDPDVRSLFQRARERLGFIPNVFKVYAARPEHFKKWRAHFNEVT